MLLSQDIMTYTHFLSDVVSVLAKMSLFLQGVSSWMSFGDFTPCSSEVQNEVKLTGKLITLFTFIS